jgi:FKBP-type peptidyl-prolyl cis-trans isomerase
MSRWPVLSLLAAMLLGGCNTQDEPKAPPAAPPPVAPGTIPAPPDVKAAPADAQKTPSGLASKVLAKGPGDEHPGPGDAVEVHYTGWKTDGTMFDSSVVRKTPVKFQLSNVIKGWTEGVQLMVRGEKRRFWIPANLAYGDPAPGNRPSGMLVFDIELLDFHKTPPPPATPADVAAPPKDARRTRSGLAYRVLQKGTGKAHPDAKSTVQLHYTGWTPEGKIVDSSIVRGEPVTVAMSSYLPPGWNEALPLMVEGEKARFWVPAGVHGAATGAKGQPPAHSPTGAMVFDFEVLSVK